MSNLKNDLMKLACNGLEQISNVKQDINHSIGNKISEIATKLDFAKHEDLAIMKKMIEKLIEENKSLHKRIEKLEAKLK